jgi:hypothetical protein
MVADRDAADGSAGSLCAIRFCQGTCSNASAEADRTGTLVLSEWPLLNRTGRRMRQRMERDPVNGCLFLDPARPGAGEGIHAPQERRFRFLTWSLWPDGSGASFDLGRSPDGGVDVMLRLAPAACAEAWASGAARWVRSRRAAQWRRGTSSLPSGSEIRMPPTAHARTL